eukprot:SAG11_NODE_3534_length_2386_cov_3.060778_5_plen_66_part_00
MVHGTVHGKLFLRLTVFSSLVLPVAVPFLRYFLELHESWHGTRGFLCLIMDCATGEPDPRIRGIY